MRALLITLALSMFGLALAEKVELRPTDDLWIYGYAFDQQEDPFLRAWGTDGGPLGTDEEPGGTYSCLRFDLKAIKAGKKIKSAQLILWHMGEIGYSIEDAKKDPIQVRAVSPDFDEKKFQPQDADKVIPKRGKQFVFGSGYVSDDIMSDPIKIEIDLLKGPAKFREYFAASLKLEKPALGLALTTGLRPAEMGDGTIVKIYSRAAQPEKLRPMLVIEFE